VEEDLRSSCTDFIILSELRYGSLVGIDDSLSTCKRKKVSNYPRTYGVRNRNARVRNEN